MKFLLFLFLTAVWHFVQTAHAAPINVVSWGGLPNVAPDLTNALSIAAGDGFYVALKTDGTVGGYAAGVPPGLTNVVAIAASVGHSLALKADGTVVAWGGNSYGECNIPAGLTTVAAVSAGRRHSLALKADGTVVAWGGNSNGECNVPFGLSNVVAIAAGTVHSLALKADGTVAAWGPSFAPPSDLTNVVAIAAGYADIALKGNGAVVTWGYNPADIGAIPQPIDLTNVVAVAASPEEVPGDSTDFLALTATGTVVAWGQNNYYGQCNVPLDLPRALAISAGTWFSLALTDPTHAGAPPTVLGSLPTQTVAVGSTARFVVHAVGFQPLSYQWFFETSSIPGATNMVLTLPGVHVWQSGTYSVMITNGGGTATSQAMLNVLPGLDLNLVPAITLRGEVGFNYHLDFLNQVGPTNAWTNLASITITNNPQIYFDLSAIGQPQRFYRLVQVP